MERYDIYTDDFNPDYPGTSPSADDSTAARRKKKRKKKQKRKEPGRIARFFRDRRTQSFVGVLLLTAAIYIL